MPSNRALSLLEEFKFIEGPIGRFGFWGIGAEMGLLPPRDLFGARGQMHHDLKTPYGQLGGADGVNGIVEKFYDLMDSLPEFAAVRAMHGSDLSRPQQALYEFLSGWLGGPAIYFDKPGRQCIMSAHSRFRIGAEEVRQWLSCMTLALDKAGVDGELNARITEALAKIAVRMRNRSDPVDGSVVR